MIPTTMMPFGPNIAPEVHLGAGPVACIVVGLCAVIVGALLDRRSRRRVRAVSAETTAPVAPVGVAA